MLFENILKQPKKYSIQMVELTPALLKALSEIAFCFSSLDPQSGAEEVVNGFLDAAKNVSQFFALIPEFSRRSPALSANQKKLITSLETFKQPEDFFLKTLPSIYLTKDLRGLSLTEQKGLVTELSKDLHFIFNVYVDLLRDVALQSRKALSRLMSSIGSTRTAPEVGSGLAKLWRGRCSRCIT